MNAVRPWLALCAILGLVGCESEPGLEDAGVLGAPAELAGTTGSAMAGAWPTVAGATAVSAGAGGESMLLAGASAGSSGAAGEGGRGGDEGWSAAGDGGGAGRFNGRGGGGRAGGPAAGSGGREAPEVEVAGASAPAGRGEAEAPAVGSRFSFFVTSLSGMRELSGNELGFGGDLRFGEATGLAGADKICSELAERSLEGSGNKGWRAFLSSANGGRDDGPIHARDRIGSGPWYDRTGRLVAAGLSELMNTRPMGADPAIVNDLPNERGEPNRGAAMPGMDDNHDVVTATNTQGLYDGGPTCADWTTKRTPEGEGGPRVGHSWPSENSGASWIQTHQARGCAASVNLDQMGGGNGSGGRDTGIGNMGGYGAIYCFALMQ